MIWIRRFVFYFFVIIYLIVCPSTIFYALGFYIKPGADYGIVKTGLIYLSSTPSGASVSINGLMYKEKTPVVIRNLMPGYYTVRVEAKGFRTWVEQVPVEAERASVVEKLLLLPENLKTREISDNKFDELIPVPRTSYLILSRDRKVNETQIYHLKKERFKKLSDFLAVDASSKIARWYLISKSESAVLQINNKDQVSYQAVSLAGKEPAKDLSSLISQTPDQILWEPGWEDHMVSVRGDSFDYLRSDKMHVHPQVAGNIHGLGVYNHLIYALRGDHTLATMSYEGKNEKVVLRDSYLGQLLFGEDQPYHIQIFPEDRMLFLGPRGNLLSNKLPHIFAPEKIRGYEIINHPKKLVVWTATQIGVIELEVEPDSGDFFERGPHIVWVYQEGRDIRRAFWVYEGAHIVFLDGNRAFFLDLETFSKAEPHLLFEVKNNSGITYSEDTGALYFLDPDRETLQQAALTPNHERSLIAFPTRQEKSVKRKMFSL